MAQAQPQAREPGRHQVTKAHAKTFQARIKAVSSPDEATLAKIRAFTLVDIDPEQLVVREYVLAHNCVDRDRECFDEALLANFAATIAGKGSHIKHPGGWDGDSGPGEGRVYEAEVRTMSLEQARAELREPRLTLPPDRDTVHLLVTRVYYVRTPENTGLLLKMDAGIAGDVSIGFTTQNPPVKVFDPEGHEINVRRWQAPGEALEQSIVWLGAQPGARATKSAKTTEDDDMDYQKLFETEQGKTTALTAERDTLKTQAEANKSAAENLTALKTALGADAALLETPGKLAATIADGKAHRDALVKALVTADRQAKRCADDDASVKAATDDYADLPTKALQKLHDALAGTGPASFGIRGSDPGNTNADPAAGKGAFATNPAFGGVAG